jgi:Domain of unknown function (DUF4326)
VPERIQLSRKAGWRKPEGAVVVSRPSKWGNPYEGDRFAAVELFTVMLNMLRAGFPLADDAGDALTYPSDAEIRAELAGRDLACWCMLPDEPGEPDVCHAAVLLAIANAPP